jgi:hypothetical protein
VVGGVDEFDVGDVVGDVLLVVGSLVNGERE